MKIAPEIAENILKSLFRFQIEAFDLANAVAPQRAPERLAFENAQEEAIRTSLRAAFRFERHRDAAHAQVSI